MSQLPHTVPGTGGPQAAGREERKPDTENVQTSAPAGQDRKAPGGSFPDRAAGRFPKLLDESEFAEEFESTVMPELSSIEKRFFMERVPGKKIRVYYYPRANARGVLILSHGFTESAVKFRETAWYFYQYGFTVYSLDHAGHGESYRLVDDISLVHIDRWETYAEDLFFISGKVKKDNPRLPLFLFGHSMGGGIAAACAAKMNPPYAGVILSSPMIEPLTGSIPLFVTRLVTRYMEKTKRSAAPAPGYHPFDGKEAFESSPCSSRARFDHYLNLQKETPSLQTSGASCGWVLEAIRLRDYLLKKAPGYTTIPILLLQAGREELVSNKAQDRYLSLLKNGQKAVFPDAKHEIYRSGKEILTPYYQAVFQFLDAHLSS